MNKTDALSKLKRKDIQEFEFVDISPAGGKSYYSKDLDIGAIDYGYYIRIYYDRVKDCGEAAGSFRNSLIVENEL